MSQELAEVVCRQRRAQWSAIRQCKEAWYRKDAVTDEVLLLAHIGSTSVIAKMRLKLVTKRDRVSCGDGKWRNRSLVDFVGFDQAGNACFETVGKPRYRWEPRR